MPAAASGGRGAPGAEGHAAKEKEEALVSAPAAHDTDDEGQDISDDEMDDLLLAACAVPQRESPPLEAPAAPKRKASYLAQHGATGQPQGKKRRVPPVPTGSRQRRRVRGNAGQGENLGLFAALPPELIITRIMACLAPACLANLAQASRTLRLWSGEETLWKRLYLGRWGLEAAAAGAAARRHEGERYTGQRLPYKQRYFDRDAAEMREVAGGHCRAPAGVRDVFIQMQAAHREIPVEGDALLPGDLLVVDASTAEEVERWRQANGPFPPAESHACSGASCSFHCIGADVYVCRSSGCVHVCDDDTCRARVVDPTTDLLVCTVSGQCFDRLMSTEEEEGMRREYSVADLGQDGEVGSTAGRLGNAYAIGYACDTEEQLRDNFCTRSHMCSFS